jgi:hypothetical protein
MQPYHTRKTTLNTSTQPAPVPHCAEQKHVIKVPPMQTLSEALQAASSKFKPALVPAHCSLQYNKKPVDLHTPFRLLNVSAGSKLEVLIQSECSLQPRSIGIAITLYVCHYTIR